MSTTENSALPELPAVPSDRIEAYVMPDAGDWIRSVLRPCRTKRNWMDSSPSRYAYRCVPLSAANSLGWEILNPVACECIWTGLTGQDQVYVWREKETRFTARSHFGCGTVTWDLPFVFRTPPGIAMVVSGPANSAKPGIAPLDGVVRTDWLPFPFTMNWKLTIPKHPVRFEAGEPICRIFPITVDLPEAMTLELRNLDDNRAFEEHLYAWKRQRDRNYREKREAEERAAQGEQPELQNLWSRDYARQRGAESAGLEDAQTRFKCKQVVDSRGRTED